MTFLAQPTDCVVGKCYKLLFNSPRTLLVIVFIFCAGMLFYRLGGVALISPDEGRNAEVAREMSVSHSWLVPTYNGLTYLDKPSFYFKTVALSFSLFGESEWAARFSSASFGFLLLIAVFLFCRKVYDVRTAFLATLIVASTPLYLAFARIVIFDMTLAFFVCSAIFACYLAEEDQQKYRSRWYLVAVIASGIATLIKGPVGFILPTLVIGLFNAFEGRFKVMKEAFVPRNCLIFLAIVLPWFIGLSLQCPDFPYYGIMKESVARFTTPLFHRTQPVYFYALIIASTFFAWSLLLPESIYLAWIKRKKWSRADRLFIIWAIVVVVFFSISKSKLPGYILTAVVALGVLTARVFANAMTNESGRVAKLIWRGTILLLILSSSIAVALLIFMCSPEIVAGRFAPDQRELFALFLSDFLPLICSFVMTAIICAIALWQRRPRLMFLAFISVPVLLMTVNFNLLVTYGALRSARSLAAQIPTNLPPNTELACLECLPNGLPFYLQRLITVISRDGQELSSNYVLFTLKSANPWPKGIVPVTQLQAWLSSRQHPVFLIAHKYQLLVLNAIVNPSSAKVLSLDANYQAILIPTPNTH